MEDLLNAVPFGPVGCILEGTAGIGNTSVWREGVEGARRRGYEILETAPSEPDSVLAFSGHPAMDSALADHGRCRRPFEHGRTLLEKGTIERRAKRKAAAKQTLEGPGRGARGGRANQHPDRASTSYESADRRVTSQPGMPASHSCDGKPTSVKRRPTSHGAERLGEDDSLVAPTHRG